MCIERRTLIQAVLDRDYSLTIAQAREAVELCLDAMEREELPLLKDCHSLLKTVEPIHPVLTRLEARILELETPPEQRGASSRGWIQALKAEVVHERDPRDVVREIPATRGLASEMPGPFPPL